MKYLILIPIIISGFIIGLTLYHYYKNRPNRKVRAYLKDRKRREKNMYKYF